MKGLITKLKVARVIGQQMFGSEFFIVTDFNNGLVQPSQKPEIWESTNCFTFPSTLTDSEIIEEIYIKL